MAATVAVSEFGNLSRSVVIRRAMVLFWPRACGEVHRRCSDEFADFRGPLGRGLGRGAVRNVGFASSGIDSKDGSNGIHPFGIEIPPVESVSQELQDGRNILPEA